MGPVESDFNPTDYPPEYIPVGADEPMASILERVEEAWMRSPNAVLVVPRGAQAFHTTHDFLALGKMQDSREVRISIASHDPIINSLARLLGFYLVDPPREYPDPAADSSFDNMPGGMEQATAPLPLGANPDMAPGWVFTPSTPVYPPPSSTSTWLSSPTGYLDGSRQWPEPPPKPPHQGLSPPLPRAAHTEQLLTSSIEGGLADGGLQYEPPPMSLTPSGRIKARGVLTEVDQYRNARLRYGGRLTRASWRTPLIALAVLLVLLLAGGSAYAYVYLPQGSVSVIPLNKTISDLPVEVTVLTSAAAKPGDAQTSNGAQVGPAINAGKIIAPLSEEGSRPASGSRQVPKGKAQGYMRFTNRTSNPVSVPAGAQFKAPNGVIIQTAQGGTVPATIFGQSFGTLDLPIVATVEGPDGNIGAGQVSGIYGGSLNYVNSAMQGGTLDTLKVIEQADIDGLVTDLRAKVESEAAGAVLGMVGPGQQLITQTISLANARFEADHKAGEDADSVQVRFNADAEANVYKESDMHDSIAQAVLDSVQTGNPRAVGPNLDMGSVQYSPPSVASVDQGKVTYQANAGGRVTYSLTPELAAQIRDLVKGKAINQARNLIFQQYGSYVNPDSIEAKLLWFTLDKLPNDPERITVEASSQTSYPSVPLPDRQITPDPRSQP